MRMLVLGGTRFIGRAIVEELAGAGHDVTVVHRGEVEPEGFPDVEHLHLDRAALPEHHDALAATQPDAVVDTLAMTRTSAEIAVAAIPDGPPVMVLSSMDVYAAYGDMIAGTQTATMPLDEESPVREERYPYKGQGGWADEYDKLDVEEVYLKRQATVARLPIVFGPWDGQRREEFILRRVRAGRKRIPFGTGNFLWSRLHAADIGTAVRLWAERGGLPGEILNLGPTTTHTVRQWAHMILAAAGSDAELVAVPDHLLPPDLEASDGVGQHLLTTNHKARTLLEWEPADHEERVADSVRWHLEHPPAEASDDFSADDAALEAALPPRAEAG